MKPLLVSKPVMGLVLLLLIVQMACAASSVSPSPTPPTLQAGTASTQAARTPPAASSPPALQGTQAIPSTGGQGTSPASGGSNQPTPANAQAMLNAAAQHYQSVGREQALKDFTDRKPPFDSEGMYIVCLGTDHKITAFGGYGLLVGISADSISVTNGQPLGNLVWDAAAVQPQGSIPFHWKNPLTTMQESKILYYQKLSQDICGVVANNP